jgi:hypothetical protein
LLVKATVHESGIRTNAVSSCGLEISFGFEFDVVAVREALAFGVSATGVVFALDDFTEDEEGTLSGSADIVVGVRRRADV